jgi:hypothetical protein
MSGMRVIYIMRENKIYQGQEMTSIPALIQTMVIK